MLKVAAAHSGQIADAPRNFCFPEVLLLRIPEELGQRKEER